MLTLVKKKTRIYKKEHNRRKKEKHDNVNDHEKEQLRKCENKEKKVM